MTEEEILYWYDKAKEYAESHLDTDSPNPDKQSVWLRDALYCAYLSAIKEITKTRLI